MTSSDTGNNEDLVEPERWITADEYRIGTGGSVSEAWLSRGGALLKIIGVSSNLEHGLVVFITQGGTKPAKPSELIGVR